MVTTEEKRPTLLTGSPMMDRSLGGGLPLGSLTLIEGSGDSGKSVLSQHLARGALNNEGAVAYYTTEDTVKGFLKQMASLQLDVAEDFLLGRLRVYPIRSPATQEIEAEVVFSLLAKHIKGLPEEFKTIIVDSVTMIVTHGTPMSVLDFFARCKEMCDDGWTITISAHNYAFEQELLGRLSSLCDAHLELRTEQVGEKLVKMLEVSKVRGTERSAGNVVGFEVEPGLGFKVIPFSRTKA